MGTFGTILGHFGVIFGTTLDHFGTILRSFFLPFLGRLRVVFVWIWAGLHHYGSFCGHIGVILGQLVSFRVVFGVISGSFEAIFGQPKNPFLPPKSGKNRFFGPAIRRCGSETSQGG